VYGGKSPGRSDEKSMTGDEKSMTGDENVHDR